MDIQHGWICDILFAPSVSFRFILSTTATTVTKTHSILTLKIIRSMLSTTATTTHRSSYQYICFENSQDDPPFQQGKEKA